MPWGYSYTTGQLVECDRYGYAYDSKHGQCQITNP
jgi:hypothetical protein